MGYTRQNFEDGKILHAENLIKIEDGIIAVEKAMSKLPQEIPEEVVVGEGEMPKDAVLQILLDASDDPTDIPSDIKVPTKLSQLENDTEFINKNVTNLTNYYNKENTYNKEETNALVSSIPKFTRKVVDFLPYPGEENTLYLVRKGETESAPNMFEEWIWVENDWELLGAQKVNLVEYALKIEVPSIVEEALKAIYPVGAIYISASEINPAVIFNFGQWEQIKDRFLLASGDNYVAGEMAGEATHKLTPNELPKMGGSFEMHGIGGTNPGSAINAISAMEEGRTQILSPLGEIIEGRRRDGGQSFAEADVQSLKGVSIRFGNDQPHNNMPPYLAVYVWKRIA